MLFRCFLFASVMDALAGATTQIKRVKAKILELVILSFYSLDLRRSPSKSIHHKRTKKKLADHLISVNDDKTLSHMILWDLCVVCWEVWASACV